MGYRVSFYYGPPEGIEGLFTRDMLSQMFEWWYRPDLEFRGRYPGTSALFKQVEREGIASLSEAEARLLDELMVPDWDEPIVVDSLRLARRWWRRGVRGWRCRSERDAAVVDALAAFFIGTYHDCQTVTERGVLEEAHPGEVGFRHYMGARDGIESDLGCEVATLWDHILDGRGGFRGEERFPYLPPEGPGETFRCGYWTAKEVSRLEQAFRRARLTKRRSVKEPFVDPDCAVTHARQTVRAAHARGAGVLTVVA